MKLPIIGGGTICLKGAYSHQELPSSGHSESATNNRMLTRAVITLTHPTMQLVPQDALAEHQGQQQQDLSKIASQEHRR